MQSFVIEGGRPLTGTIRTAGNKNGALPILAATVLASGPVVLTNVPRIRDVETMVDILVDLGAKAAWSGAQTTWRQEEYDGEKFYDGNAHAALHDRRAFTTPDPWRLQANQSGEVC